MSAELDEIWALYADDGAQSLDLAERSLLHLKDTPCHVGRIAAVFRAIHTFKGNARVLGLGVIESCAHAAEDLIGLVRDENVFLDGEIISLLLEAADVLREMMMESLALRADPPAEKSEALTVRIKAKIEQCRAAKEGGVNPCQAVIFEPAEQSDLAQDEVCRDIFNGMASDALRDARGMLEHIEKGEAPGLGSFALRLDQLRFAAEHMGMPVWVDAITEFLSVESPAAAELRAFIAKLEGLMTGVSLDTPAAADEQGVDLGVPDHEPVFVERQPSDLGTAKPAPGLDPSALAADPTYRGIFFDTVHDILLEMQEATAEFESAPERYRQALASQIDRLIHASNEIGMPGWPEFLAEFPAHSKVSHAEARDFVLKLETLIRRDNQEDKPNFTSQAASKSNGVCAFFDALAPLLAAVSTYGGRLISGMPGDSDGFLAKALEIRSRAEALGFVCVADIAGQLADERQPRAFRSLELRLYEELTRIAQAMPFEVQPSNFAPAVVLQNWCADHASDNLDELNRALETLGGESSIEAACDSIIELLRLIHHACRRYAIETAANLAMSLVDLFARTRDNGAPPSGMLLQIARSFRAELEQALHVVGNGGTPDTAPIEKLFEEATNLAFTASGAIASAEIETRLGLPKSFRKVLTPESLKAAKTALNDGKYFYIVRTDLNNNDAAAANFLEWINSGAATVISNITVFKDGGTLFDFLLATSLGESHLAEALAALDPTREALKIKMALSGGAPAQKGEYPPERTAPGDDASGALASAAHDIVARDMLEGIGEIVTGHAMIDRMVADLAAEDIAGVIDAELAKAGGEWSKAQPAVRQALEAFAGRVEKVHQAEAQLSTQLERLQEEAIAVRSRPATLLTKPLEAFAEADARQKGREVFLVMSGEDLMLDHAMLEEIRPHLRSLISFCVSWSIEPAEQRISSGKDRRGEIRLALARSDGRVLATIEDDGLGLSAIPEGEANRRLAEARLALRNRGGDLRTESSAKGGIRFHISLPMGMVVLDGMVVRVGEFRYVVPLEGIQRIVYSGLEDVMRVSAGEGRRMLRLGRDDVLPVHVLQETAGEGAVRDSNRFGDQKRLFVVVGNQSHRVALIVDELLGHQLVLIRPLRGYLTGIRGVTGCALLSGGEIGMVLDIARLLTPLEREEDKHGAPRVTEAAGFLAA